MYRFAVLAVLAITSLSGPATAQDREILGFGRLFTNDFFGDREDRWRSGGYQFSILHGPEWTGVLPTRPGEILEYRLRTEIITPSKGTGPIGDRPYVGALSAGVHSPFALGPLDASIGIDLTAIGPQTGISDFQDAFHDVFSLPAPLGTSAQLENAFLASATAEMSWPVRVSEQVTLRPFVEAQAGVEDILRVGGDIIVGTVAHDDLLLRDATTGQLIRGIEAPIRGVSVLFGGDWASVGNSEYLPEDQGFTPEDERFRMRAGLHWQLFEEVSFFYGVTYLSEEFVGQSEGQVVGGLKLNFNF
ncbi:lipid A-modifier LpxR family protein [Flavimaricola marinus]|uniref:Lipid A deacylase LpxR family protein n=1 Tax=Flavimaricola marinus TaxID=1819565 RepID=A0A238LAJ1_9RHOB|nr:lipid A-modifier LpxR family protein [Flavimaricola marinus]SMY05976.1 hypothetical protein LOM8899_00097 [Flavimaricola marinus]